MDVHNILLIFRLLFIIIFGIWIRDVTKVVSERSDALMTEIELWKNCELRLGMGVRFVW